ncbi:MAG: IS1380 family transposase [Planctomycetota bacterium]|jgi:hypothetical protein
MDRIVFSSLGRKKIHTDFQGGRLTSDAGGLLLREADRHLGLVEALDRCIPDPRDPEAITHTQRTLLAQRIFGIALGYEDLNDHQQIRYDPLMQVVTERGPDEDEPLASAPTLCRLENRVSRESLVAMAAVPVDMFIASFAKTPTELVLDFDATDDPVYGHQEGRFFHGYYDHYCFLPLYVFCQGQLLVSYLRPSKIDAAKHSRAILKLLVQRLRQAWPQVRIIVRADSGFCRWRLLRWCDRHDVGYVIGLAKNAVLLRQAQPWSEQVRRQYEVTGEKQRFFADIRYAAQTWDHRRRVIVKAEHMAQGSNTRFVVTNLQDNAQSLYEDRYCQRGDMENRIKEQQLYLFADRTSCHNFLANQFRLMLSSAAYILVETLRRVGLADTELAHAQVNTIRLKLFKVAGRICQSVRRIVFHLCSSFPYAIIFQQIVTRLRAVGPLNPSAP